MIPSPLCCPGGKSRSVETITKLIPDFDAFVLKRLIFVTAGERSVACGSLKGRTKIMKI